MIMSVVGPKGTESATGDAPIQEPACTDGHMSVVSLS